jgi:hypothetical protein
MAIRSVAVYHWPEREKVAEGMCSVEKGIAEGAFFMVVLRWEDDYSPPTQGRTYEIVFTDASARPVLGTLSSARKHERWQENHKEVVVFNRVRSPDAPAAYPSP